MYSYDLDLIVRILAIPSILLGAVNCFFGYRIFKVLLGIAGFVLGGVAAAALGYALSSSDAVVVIAGLIGGGIGAVLMVTFYFVGVFLIGASLGGLLTALAMSTAEAHPEVVVVAVVAVISGIVALFVHKLMIIVSTAFMGAFGVVYHIAYFVAGRDMYYLERVLRYGGSDFYIILLGTAALGIAGVIVQYRWSPDPKRTAELEQSL